MDIICHNCYYPYSQCLCKWEDLPDREKRSHDFPFAPVKAMNIKELEALVPKSQAYELNPKARYLIVVENMLAERALEFQHWLLSQGLDCIVLPLPCRLFELSDS